MDIGQPAVNYTIIIPLLEAFLESCHCIELLSYLYASPPTWLTDLVKDR